eukprot:541170-Rhodomonas_salina.1
MKKQKALRSRSKGRAEEEGGPVTSSDSNASSFDSDTDTSSVSESQSFSPQPGLMMSRRSENPAQSNRTTEEDMSSQDRGPDTAADPEDGQPDGQNRAVTPPSSGGEYVEADGPKAAASNRPAKKFRIFSAGSFKKMGESLKKMSGAPASEGEHEE